MERGGIKILPITTKDVRIELHLQSTTFTRSTRLAVLQPSLLMLSRCGKWYLWLSHHHGMIIVLAAWNWI
jgi:hypothetical protein